MIDINHPSPATIAQTFFKLLFVHLPTIKDLKVKMGMKIG